MQPDLTTCDIHGLPFACRLGIAHFRAAGPVKGTVLAVHGLSRQKRDFDDMAAFLAADGYDVVCVDVPGRGQSSWLKAEEYTLDNYARALCALIDQQGWGSVHWVGTSMGGLIAMTLPLIGRADVLRSLTLVDITARPNHVACQRIAQYMTDQLPLFPDPAPYVAFVRQNLPLGDVSDAVWHRFALHQLVKTPAGYTPHFDPQIVPGAKQALAEGIDLSEGLTQIKCPIALVAGEISDLCGAGEIADFKNLKPHAPVYICPGAGHIPALADVASNGFIARFIEGTAAR